MAKFKKGQSGNPKGRPRGVPDRRSMYRDILQGHAREIIETVVKAAVGGDMTACKLLLDRILPPYKPADVPVQMTSWPACLADRGNTVLSAMACGDIGPTAAASAIAALAGQARIMEVDDLLARIQRLEHRQGGSEIGQ